MGRPSLAADGMRKENRLRANADFQRIRRKGRSLRHPLLVMAFLPNGQENSRFGFAVGRRIGNSVMRNRLKRQMREVIRLRIKEGTVAAGWDVVLIARHPIRGASYQQVDRAIGQLLLRASLLSEAL